MGPVKEDAAAGKSTKGAASFIKYQPLRTRAGVELRYADIFGSKDFIGEVLKLESPNGAVDFNILRKGQAMRLSWAAHTDAAEFVDLMRALDRDFNFDYQSELIPLLKIIGAILHLGDVMFIENPIFKQVMVTKDGETSVRVAAELLGVSYEALERSLTTKGLIADPHDCEIPQEVLGTKYGFNPHKVHAEANKNRKSAAKGGDRVTMFKQSQANTTRDELIMHLYENLFAWLVHRMNETLCYAGYIGNVRSDGTNTELLTKEMLEEKLVGKNKEADNSEQQAKGSSAKKADEARKVVNQHI